MKHKVTIDQQEILLIMQFVAEKIRHCKIQVSYHKILEEYVLVRLQKKLSAKLVSNQDPAILSLERAELEAMAKLGIWTPAMAKSINY